MSDNKKKRSSFFGTLGRWFRRAFFGPGRELLDAEKELENLSEEEREERARKMDVEEIVTPFKQYLRGFLEHKLAVGALIIVVCMFLFAFITPLFFPKYSDNYIEVTQQNMRPNMKLMNVPAKLKREGIKKIDSYGQFSVGLSNEGNVFVWGDTIVGTTGINVKNIPDSVKEANIIDVAAGFDHIIAIDDKGRIYGWGSNILGQYGKPKNTYSDSIYLPDILPTQTVEPSAIKKLACGYQVSGLLMNDGTLYLWGNGKTCNNLEKIYYMTDGKSNVDDFAFTKNDMVVIIDGKLETAKADRYQTIHAVIGDEGYPLSDYLGDRKIVSAVADSTTVCLMLSDNTICFSGDFPAQSVAIPVLSDGEYFVKICAGDHHYTALSNKGRVYSWGGNILGQCDISGIKGTASDVFAGANQSYVIDGEGSLLAKWGHRGYLFGTDPNGASVFQRIANGGRMTLTIGAVAVVISTVIGIIIGCISGYFGGKVDIFLMRVTEVVSAIPFLPFAMILSAFMGRVAISEDTRIFIIMVILGILTWPGLAHMIRGQVLVTRENEYVTAAKAMGVKERTIAFKHILPNVISIIIVNLTLDFAGCLLTESGLSYLGFGVQLPRPTWGNMLNKANNSTTIQNFWWEWLFPALFLAATTICINMIGDALRDVMDPKSNSEK